MSAQSLPKVRVVSGTNGFQTEDGRPFVPFGVNYYQPGTGWAPKLWKMLDLQRVRKDFALMKEYGANCVRVFITYGSFYMEDGKLSDEGLAKFDQFLALAEEAGIYVHPTGPDHWEGRPDWLPADPYADERNLKSLEAFWKLFAARYKGRGVIFAYDLLNEPVVRWNTDAMQARWNTWTRKQYASAAKAEQAWGLAAGSVNLDQAPIPAPEDKPGSKQLLDYQIFREGVADEWTRRQSAAIKSADPQALVTVGFIQWSIPSCLPKLDIYAAFRPDRQAKYLDFLEFHFYPLETGSYEYDDPDKEQHNIAYLEGIAREVAKMGKPVVMAEFGWYGGGTYPIGKRESKPATDVQQADFVGKLVEVTAGHVTGWLNWGLHDHPEARDCSRTTGLFTVDGQPKAWALRFKELAARYKGKLPPAPKPGSRPELLWEECMVSKQAGNEFRERYFKAFE